MKLKEILNRWQTELYQCGWNSLFWNNHDLPRIVSRWGNDKEYRVESAKMLAILLHGMQGTPYIYQGEELGMTNVRYNMEEYRDIETVNLYKERKEQGYTEEEIMRSIYAKSRDNARTPMQWDDSANAGFTDGEPWMKINPNYVEINAKDQVNDPDSIFSCYKKLVHLRKEYGVFADGRFELLLKEAPSIFAYTRENETHKMLVICNFYGETVTCPLAETENKENAELLISNYKTIEQPGVFRPYEARIYMVEK